MATSGPTNLPAFFSTDADFRTWGSGINAAMAAVGLVQTADTGQVNWTTVTKPAGSNTFQGYEIWRFNDTSQSTTPIFFKIEYGSGGATDRPSIRTTFGTASNGTGTITGTTVAANQQSQSNSKLAGNTLPLIVAGGAGYFTMCISMDTTSNQNAIWMFIERSRSTAGAVTTDGFVTGMMSGFGGNFNIVAAGSATGVTTLLPPVVGRSPFNLNSAFSNLLWFLGTPIFGLVAGRCFSADLAALGTASVTINGSAHTYIGLNLSNNNLYAGTSTSSDTIAMLWE